MKPLSRTLLALIAAAVVAAPAASAEAQAPGASAVAGKHRLSVDIDIDGNRIRAGGAIQDLSSGRSDVCVQVILKRRRTDKPPRWSTIADTGWKCGKGEVSVSTDWRNCPGGRSKPHVATAKGKWNGQEVESVSTKETC
ncbi:hypothetical protein [Actinomadura rubrisoli]|uniref:Uncharacterized protein n=1 Tax=Actinomadura rubrisoli TaxID=2530368 RepID=A0A4R5BFB1_9ACTN|nr:hypothetical protein [Actinomadura rubrisoli]TDD83953.1 hypothetical protein E1298_20640 [Actinomadura rubrisoli]